MVRVLPVLIVFAWVLACTEVRAATVTATSITMPDPEYGTSIDHRVQYTAAPGETNRLQLTVLGERVVRFHDPAGLTAVGLCVAEDPLTARCPATRLQIALGDGDDTLTGPQHPFVGVMADGGDGDDVLATPGTLIGGGGDDRLTGTRVQGGLGADVLQGQSFDYSDHLAGVVFDFAGGLAGSPGENDTVIPGELMEFIGGPGPDVVRASDGRSTHTKSGAGNDVIDGGPLRDWVDPGPGDDVVRTGAGSDAIVEQSPSSGDDRLEAGPGDDYVLAGAGDDVLDGGPGDDLLRGMTGADQLLARDGTRDRVECGEGALEGDRAVLDGRDAQIWCEQTARSGAPRLELHGLVATGRRRLALIVSCPREASRRACTGTARTTTVGERVFTRSVRVRPGRRARLAVASPVSTRHGFVVRLALRTGHELRVRL